MTRKMNKTVNAIFDVLLATGFEGSYINEVEREGDVLRAWVQLPAGKAVSDLSDLLPNLRQQVGAIDCKIGQQDGKRVQLLFGLKDLSDVPFITAYINPDTIKLSLMTSYGVQYFDFSDGASCHLLNAGAPRMGKTLFLLYCCTMLYIQTEGRAKIFINSTKDTDFFPFWNLPNCRVENSPEAIFDALQEMIQEYKRRNALLHLPELYGATDAKSVKKLYPAWYKHFEPMFLIIDEYGRFAKDTAIQESVMELVETAGFVNVHVIISTQRPDARTVLPPRIKQGLQARLCFRVPDKNNSIVILDTEGAELLPKQEGRAILLDGDMTNIRVPFMPYDKCIELLKPYKGEETSADQQKGKGFINQALSDEISGLFKESTVHPHFQKQFQPGQRMQQSHEKAVSGWDRLASPQDKR